LHGNEDADIEKGDTLTNPQFTKGNQLRTFDFIVMNPPFSTKSWSNGLENEYGRFEFGRPPEKSGDYAFLLHVLKSLKSHGKAAVILPHGVLFRGNAEASIRRQLLQRGYIKGIIGLPPNLFYGTGIPACVVILDKENATGRTGVFMINASKGFMKDGPKNRLRSQDIHQIVDVFNKQTEIERYSRMVPLAEIASEANDYNLNIPRYIDSSEPEDIQDLHAHLHGGIPDRDIGALGEYWDAFPQLVSVLFKPNRPGYSDLAIDVDHVQQAILDSDEFKQFAKQTRTKIEQWFAAHRHALESIGPNTKPSELIANLGDTLLAEFKAVPLLDSYNVYEQFLSYWHATMHDDVFLIMNDGWAEAAKPRKAVEDKDRKLTETPDFVIGSGRAGAKYKMDLIPPGLIVARYFADEKATVDNLNAAAEDATRAVEDYTEEHAVEDGSDPDEIKALQHLIELYTDEAAAKRALRDAQAALDLATLKKYGDLSEQDVKTLVLEDKWRATITKRISTELQALTLNLVGRTKQLGERYGETLRDVQTASAQLTARVAHHLAEMGIK
jgi:type I restriction enzyme M protein